MEFEYYKYDFKGVFISQHQKGFLSLAVVALAHIFHPAAAVPVPDHRHKGLTAVSADNAQIKAGFHELYQAMDGMELWEMDQTFDTVCALFRDHERSGFVAGVRIGVRPANELI